MVRLAPLDLQILKLLQEDARLSFREVAQRVGSTTPTVSARVKALEDLGILRGYHARLDHALLGGTRYVIAATVHPRQATEAHEALARLPGAHGVYLLPGGRLVAHVHLRPPASTLARLHEAFAQLPGIQTYEASEVILSHEQEPLGELPELVEVPCHQCHGPIHGDPVKGRFGQRAHVFCCRQCLGDFRDRFETHEAAARKDRPSRTGREGAA